MSPIAIAALVACTLAAQAAGELGPPVIEIPAMGAEATVAADGNNMVVRNADGVRIYALADAHMVSETLIPKSRVPSHVYGRLLTSDGKRFAYFDAMGDTITLARCDDGHILSTANIRDMWPKNLRRRMGSHSPINYLSDSGAYLTGQRYVGPSEDEIYRLDFLPAPRISAVKTVPRGGWCMIGGDYGWVAGVSSQASKATGAQHLWLLDDTLNERGKWECRNAVRVLGMVATDDTPSLLVAQGTRWTIVDTAGKELAARQTEVHRAANVSGKWISAGAISPDQKWVVTSLAPGEATMEIWRVSDGERVATLSRRSPWWHSVRFSADSRFLLCASGHQIVVYDVESLNTRVQ